MGAALGNLAEGGNANSTILFLTYFKSTNLNNLNILFPGSIIKIGEF